MRAFIALPLPPSDAEVIEALQERLTVGRTVPPENLHLTLAFLDEQPLPMLEAVHEELTEITGPAITLALSEFQSLGGHGGHALAIRADGGAALRDLQARLLSRLRGLGLELPRRRFRPHVTVARLPGRMTPEQQEKLGRFLARESPVGLPNVRIDRVTLYRSILHKTGAIHEPLADYPLGS
ncbi:RNA 2',3'-cyclic phosphodiesterase [Thalassococcus sp. BH17M4-6]|uniref:RNA 2',3'-cyclic phosphodiesterase n=1 Tax=Thalassococcus sp. BH17M4-6 TaxID=3413148 RepID=UPI003BE39D21